MSGDGDGAAEVAAIALPLESAEPSPQKAVHIRSTGHGSPGSATPPATAMPPTMTCTASVSRPSRAMPTPAAHASLSFAASRIAPGVLAVVLAAVPPLAVIIGVVAPT